MLTWQNLSDRKVLRFIGFYRENFLQICFICIESAAIAQSICRENFCDSSKPGITAKVFSRVAFVDNSTYL